ncbi:MAG: peptidoglycan DD-metalloendopeptidase family protein [bacterium]
MIAFRRENRYDKSLRYALALLLLALSCTSGYAKKPDSSQDRIEQARKKVRAIEEKIRENEEKRKKMQAGEQDILQKIEIIDQHIEKYRYKREVLDDKISVQKKKQEDLVQEMNQLQDSLAGQKNFLTLRIRSLYKAGPLRFWRVILDSGSLIELSQKVSYMRLIAKEDSRLIRTFSRQVEDLQVKKEKMLLYQQEIEELQRRTVEQERQWLNNKKEKKMYLDALRKEETECQLTHQGLSSRLHNIQILLTDLEKNRLQQRQSPASGFSARKGRLFWPTRGKVISLAPFGKPNVESTPRASILQKGITIQAPAGAEIYSIYSGKVVYADWCIGYGKLLIVDHGEGYCSIYAHAAELLVGCGDFVQERQLIARIGDTGTVREPQLYFEIRCQGDPVDPLKWLQ